MIARLIRARSQFVPASTLLLACLVATSLVVSNELRTALSHSGGSTADGTPFIGITYLPLSHEVASRYGLSVESGLLLTDIVDGGPAATSGLRRGDVLLSIDSTPLTATSSAQRLLGGRRIGDQIPLQVHRDGATFSATIILGSRR